MRTLRRPAMSARVATIVCMVPGSVLLLLVVTAGVVEAATSAGTVRAFQKISNTEGGFGGGLDYDDLFGAGVASLGDVDGDGITDVAVGVFGDDDGGFNTGAVWILLLNTDGTVKAEQKISDTQGGFEGELSTNAIFGVCLAGIGDLDGDGVPDLAVGNYGDDDGGLDRGAIWIVFLNTDGTVKTEQKISDTQGGFNGTLSNSDLFGSGVADVGDLDSDGVTDLAVGAWQDDDGGADRGAIWILFLNSDGTVKSEQKISDTQGGFEGTLDNGDQFGTSVAGIGDLDGDGVTDLAVGAAADDDGGTDRGAVWILFMNSDGTVNAEQKISDTAGGFAGTLDDTDRFGCGVAGPGDLDSDCTLDLTVGAQYDDDGGSDRGACWILFLNSDGTVKSEQKISDTQGGFEGTLDNSDVFGASVAGIGDLDGDGGTDLIVGAICDDDGNNGAGAVWILFLEPTEDTTAPEITCPGPMTVECDASTDPNDTGMATATDNCDPAPTVTYADAVTLTSCLADPILKIVERTWTAADAAGNTASCLQTITVLKVVGDLDIKPGSCPNSFNRGSHGVLPVGLLGTGTFDVATVDVSSVRLSRADCVGGSAAPYEGPPGPHSVIADVGTPFEGGFCACHELEGDGIDDLSMKFKVDDLVPALELESLSAGALVELVVTGTLDDGCDFVASDCVRLVPPNSPPVNLRVNSTASGAWFDVDPLDLRLDGGGFSEPGFDRTFPETSVVTVTAASTFRGRSFIGWLVHGATELVTDTSVAVTMDGDHTLEAVYSAPVPVLVASEPAADGTLPKMQNNVILLTFDMSISMPAGPALRVVPIAGGADLAGSFAYSVEPDGATLRAMENAVVLSDLAWYRITPAAEFGVAPFAYKVCTLRGDADGSGRVTTADYVEVKAHMGDCNGNRCDLDGSGRVTTADYGVVKDHLSHRAPATP